MAVCVARSSFVMPRQSQIAPERSGRTGVRPIAGGHDVRWRGGRAINIAVKGISKPLDGSFWTKRLVRSGWRRKRPSAAPYCDDRDRGS